MWLNKKGVLGTSGLPPQPFLHLALNFTVSPWQTCKMWYVNQIKENGLFFFLLLLFKLVKSFLSKAVLAPTQQLFRLSKMFERDLKAILTPFKLL